MKKNSAVFFILAACLLWALDTLIRYPLVYSGVSIVKIVFWEHLVLALLFSLKLGSVFKRMNRRHLLAFLVLGVGGSALATLMFTKAFSLAHPTVVILIQKSQPIFALFLTSVWIKEKLSPRFLIWCAGALAGGLIMISEDVYRFFSTANNTVTSDVLLGYSFALIASLLWGCSTVVGKYLSLEKFSAADITSGRVFIAAITLAPILIYNNEGLEILVDGLTFGKVLIMSFLSGFLGLLLYYNGLKSVRASLATIAEMSFPVWVVLLNWLVLKQSLTGYQICGAVLLLFCMYFIQKEDIASQESGGTK